MTEEPVDVEAFREDLVDKLESMREFRAQEAAENPDDERFARAAEALRTSFHEVDALPAVDDRLRVLAGVALGRDDQRRMRYIEAEDHLIGRHGMDGGSQTTDELLGALAAAAEGAGG